MKGRRTEGEREGSSAQDGLKFAGDSTAFGGHTRQHRENTRKRAYVPSRRHNEQASPLPCNSAVYGLCCLPHVSGRGTCWEPTHLCSAATSDAFDRASSLSEASSDSFFADSRWTTLLPFVCSHHPTVDGGAKSMGTRERGITMPFPMGAICEKIGLNNRRIGGSYLPWRTIEVLSARTC